LDKTTYQAGSVVKGVVYLKIQPDSNERVKSIGLILEGEERTAVSYTESVGGNEERHHGHDFHRHHQTLQQNPGAQNICCDSENQLRHTLFTGPENRNESNLVHRTTKERTNH
jgi:hypothetical protein